MIRGLKTILLTIALTIGALCSVAQNNNKPIKWSEDVEMTSSDQGIITITATIAPGWHLYATDLPAGGPESTEIKFSPTPGVTMIGELEASLKPTVKFDGMFDLNLGYWENKVVFSQRFKVSAPQNASSISGTIHFMGCNDISCLSPSTVPFEIKIAADGTAKIDTTSLNEPQTAIPQPDADTETVTLQTDSDGHQTPVANDWWHIALWGFIGGLLALVTPCVWPMVPLTVSFFLKKNSSRGRSIVDAMIYGLAIIVIYLLLGLAVTLIFGAGKLNDLATNAIFNLIFFALLVVFAISFFGAFDIKLPARWSNSVDSKAERTTGLISMFFMAFTLVLVSFSCTGPLIGTLLVEAAAQGAIAGPAIGMGAFALALAIPFTIFAIFPSLLKEMPRSGGWLNSVKVVLGFLELALSLKFLSVVDLAYGWRILDREVFIALWIVIFTLLGVYLLGKIRFSHDAPTEHVSIPRFFLALFSLSFALYLLPGLWGAPLKSVSAFVPPVQTQDFNLHEKAKFIHFNDYDEGMAYAREHDMPVMVDFSGYGCVNCRKMEGKVFDEPAVKQMIEQNYVLITLMVDDKQALANPIEITDNGKQRKLTTVGEKWGYLQQSKFHASAQPFIVLLDGNGKMLTKRAYPAPDQPAADVFNPANFLSWLQSGLNNYNDD